MHSRPADNSGTVKAGIYCRISLARDGDTTKTDDQERICRDLARILGWEVVDVYPDKNKSAWQPNRKRPEWKRMLDDVESGRINGIITYHGDRLLRTHDDLLLLLRLARAKGVRLASPSGSRDLDSYDDQFILEIEASMAKRESANISRRRKAQYERWRRQGLVRPGGRGGRAFGFATDNATPYPADRCIVATRQEVSEADIIREIAGRILAGEGVYGIAKNLTARGWTTSTGGPLSQSFIRKMIVRPRYAGIMPDGESKAAWEPVLDRETWERVRLALDARAAFNPAPSNGRRWLLSGLAICGQQDCGLPLQRGNAAGVTRYSYTSYACPKGHVRRRTAHLDAYVSERVVHLLNDPRQPEGELPVAPARAAEWAALTAERAEAEAAAKSYANSPGRLDILMARLDSIDARMAGLREREAGDARSRLLGTYRGITREGFAALSLDVRRALVAASYQVIVLPASKRGPGFRSEDVRLDPA